jgi:O-antigen/teichoic acid export membrane protein
VAGSSSSAVAAPAPAPVAVDPGAGAGRTAGAAVATLVSLVGSAALTAGLTLALIHLLSKHEYGLFALGVGVVQIVVLASDLGVTYSTSRRLAASVHDGRLGRIAASGLFVRTAGVVAVCGALAVAAPLLAGALASRELTPVLRVAALAAAGQALLQFCRVCLAALGSAREMLLAILLEGAFEVVVSIALVLATTTAVAAMAGRAVAFALGALLAIWLLARVVGGLGRPERSEARTIGRRGLPLAIADLTWVLFLQIDVLLIGALLTAADVASFEAPLRALAFGGYVGYALGLAIGPRLAADATRLEAARHLRFGLRLAAAAQGLLAIGWVLIVAPAAPLLFGGDYRSSTDVMYALAPYLYLSATLPLLSLALVYTGRGSARAAIYAGALALNVVLDLALLGPLGVMGAAIGSNVALALLLALHVRFLRDLPGLGVRALARPIVVCGLAAAACAALGLLAGLAGAGARVVALVPCALLFLALTSIAGCWSRADVQAMLRALPRPRARV